MLSTVEQFIPDTGSSDGFRRFLQGELIRRCKQNPKYSLRAFARSLGIGPAFLSMMLNSKRAITEATIKTVGLKLGLSPAQIEGFSQRKSDRADSSDVVAPDYRQIALDHFQVIADWYHYAILELVSVDGFEPNHRWVAKTLGISAHESKAAVERLVRLEMLKISEDGEWVNISGNNTNVDNEFVVAARRKLQKQVLERAVVALEETPIQRRDQSSMTMAIDTTLFPEAKRKLTRFRRELTRFLQSGNTRDEVYNLSLSLYPLTNLSRKGAPR